MTSEDALGNAGYVVTGSGGGGTGGGYEFASIDELNTIISEWKNIGEGVLADKGKIAQAQSLFAPPASDEMSRAQAFAAVESLGKAIEHNTSMRSYIETYIAKLTAARDQYLADDDRSAARLRGIDVG